MQAGRIRGGGRDHPQWASSHLCVRETSTSSGSSNSMKITCSGADTGGGPEMVLCGPSSQTPQILPTHS